MMKIFYHGGAPGLLPGDFILPASMTGAKNTLDYLGETEGLKRTEQNKKYRDGLKQEYRDDRVYIAQDLHYALFMALSRRSDAFGLYEVEPVGEIETDPDWASDPEQAAFIGVKETMQCEKALVVDVVELPDEVVARARQLMTRPGASIPNLAERIANGRRQLGETDEKQQRRIARRKFEKKQRKIAQRARKRCG